MPLSQSSSARRKTFATSPAPSGSSLNRWLRESSGAFTKNPGFCVVAPMSRTFPSSTSGKRRSCCALLKRWISSTKSIVRSPRLHLAAASSSRSCAAFERTAFIFTNRERVWAAMTLAKVVFPHPGGP